MQTLVGRDEYRSIEKSFWKHGRMIIGLLCGSVMCLASIIQQASVLGFGLALSMGIVIGGLTGVGFGWLWSWAMHRSSQKFFDRVYAGDVAVVGNPPGTKRYPSRLPCSVFVTNNVTVGGVLYLGPSGVLFIPHRRYRGEQPIELGPEGLVVWAVDWKPNWWGKTFVASGPRVLEVGSGEQRYRFAFPNPDVVLPSIREALGQ